MLIITPTLQPAAEACVLQLAAQGLLAMVYDVSIEAQCSYRELKEFYSFYLPRAAGVILYGTTIAILGFVWLSYEVYDSGRVFRQQFESATQLLQRSLQLAMNLAASHKGRSSSPVVALLEIAVSRLQSLRSIKVIHKANSLWKTVALWTSEIQLSLTLLWLQLQQWQICVRKVLLEINWRLKFKDRIPGKTSSAVSTSALRSSTRIQLIPVAAN